MHSFILSLVDETLNRSISRSKRHAGTFWAPFAAMMDAMDICANDVGVCAAYEALLQLQTAAAQQHAGPVLDPHMSAPSAAFPILPRCVCKAKLLICKQAA